MELGEMEFEKVDKQGSARGDWWRDWVLVFCHELGDCQIVSTAILGTTQDFVPFPGHSTSTM
jgi:hypothetical protein